MNELTSPTEEFSPIPNPNPSEVPLRQPDEFEDVPLPRRVTRETDAGADPKHDKEDLRQGDEGIDDPAPPLEA
ncbi:hypothetical protein SAMN02745166_00864 [Prosthecobacter debontii]|uniref:Uncharacterized protein n=1 Tax=Prosthecobacter debontii TaxID=48467 RepID=A0A1T4WY67_9BACT|nr:hypothetical protein [Prosthecobacter debontii]SKA82107.1 hypothetical protein SAMN02745166_00864 [Prosthecobacter debontii]